jgi:hypothetical protein
VRGENASVQPEPVIYRDEAVAMLFAIHDMHVNLLKLVHLLGGDDGEEAPPEDDA